VQGGATLGATDGPRAWCGGKLRGLNIVVGTDAAGTSEGATSLGGNIGDDNKLKAAKYDDRAGAVDAIVKATSCGVDDTTIVVFMLEELAVAEGVDPPGNDITSS
ncbi:Hypothetical predicted protein, partial [Paramuricea clavata]